MKEPLTLRMTESPQAAPSHRRERSVPAAQLTLGLGSLVAATATATESRNGRNGKHLGKTSTEEFETGGDGRIYRVVARREGGVARTLVAKLPVGARAQCMAQAELRALADAAYLRDADPPLLEHVDPAVPDQVSEVRVVDIFSGCGGMSAGVAEACRALRLRFRAVGALEIDEAALAVYCRNFGGPQPKRDVARMLSKRLTAPPTRRERALIEELGRVDLVVAGPPCQGHSNLNNETRRADPRNELYFRLARFVRLFRPKWLIVENVQAVLHDSHKVVRRTRRALEKMGYSVEDGVVRLADLGVPQTRRRHVLMAVRTPSRTRVDLSERNGPKLPEIVARFRVPHRDLRWAIGDLEHAQANGVFDSSAVASDETKSRIKWLFDHDAYELDDALRPECHRDGSRHENGRHRYVGVYGRMRWDKPGPTITGGYDTMGRGRFVHPSRQRTVTPHEAARIQFFPDRFDFSPTSDTRTRLAQIIGNAVPPKLTYVIALELLR